MLDGDLSSQYYSQQIILNSLKCCQRRLIQLLSFRSYLIEFFLRCAVLHSLLISVVDIGYPDVPILCRVPHIRYGGFIGCNISACVFRPLLGQGFLHIIAGSR